MMTLPDTENMFLPQPEDLLVPLNDSYDIIMQLLDNFPNYFARSMGIDSCFNSAITAAQQICQHIGGKMLVF